MNSESGYRVVYGELIRGLLFLSNAAETPDDALKLYGPSCLWGVGIVHSKTLAGAIKQAKMCRFTLV